MNGKKLERRTGLIAGLDTKTKVFGLVALILEASFLASITVLPSTQVIYGLAIAAVVFVVMVIGLIALEKAEGSNNQPISRSGLTPDEPPLQNIIRGVMQTVCRGVSIPTTPEEAKLRAFIFKKEGQALKCTHFWAPDSMLSKERVGLTFLLNQPLNDEVVVRKAYFNQEPTRTAVHGAVMEEGMEGEVSEDLNFVLAVPIFEDEKHEKIWGVVDIDSSNEIGRELLSTKLSDNMMWHLAEHIRLLFSLAN